MSLYKAVGLAVARAEEVPSGILFTIILNVLSAFLLLAVALNVKFNVVEAPDETSVGSPDYY